MNNQSEFQVQSILSSMNNKSQLDQLQFRYQEPCELDESGFAQTLEASKIVFRKQCSEPIKINFFKVQQIVKRSLKYFFQKVFPRRLSLLTKKKLFFINDQSIFIDHFQFSCVDKDKERLQPIKTMERNAKKTYETFLNNLLNIMPLFQPNSKLLILWNSINAMLKLALVFIYSFHQFFFVPLCQEQQITIYRVIFSTILFFLLFDVFVKFNKILIKEGVYVLDKRQIAVQYFKGRFFKDFLSLIPVIVTFFDNITNTNCQNFEENLKFTPKFFINFLIYLMIANFYDSVAQIEQQFQLTPFLKTVIKLQRLVLILLIQSHMVGCCFKLTSDFGKGYLGYESTWISASQIDDKSWIVQYIYSFYWATTTMLTVGYGDMIPQTPLEVLVVTLVMFLGCGVFGFMINQIGSLISEINQSNQELATESEILTNYLNQKNISSDLIQRALSNLKYIHQFNNKTRKQQEEHIISKLSQLIQEDIEKQFCSVVLEEIDVLKNNFTVATLNKLKFEEQITTPNETITSNSSLFLLAKGKADLYMKPSKRKLEETHMHKVDEVSAPFIFGKYGFFTDQDDFEYLKSQGFCTLYKLNRKDFLELIRHNQLESGKFMELKDDILLNRNFARIEMKCQACEITSTHFLIDCPFTHLVINDHQLIKKQNNYKQPRVKVNKITKRKKKHVKALLELENLSEALMEIQMDESQMESPSIQEDQNNNGIQDSMELIQINSEDKLSIDKYQRKELDRRKTIVQFQASNNEFLLRLEDLQNHKQSDSIEIDKQQDFDNYFANSNLGLQLKSYSRYQRKIKLKKQTQKREINKSSVIILNNHERRQSKFMNQNMFNFNRRNLK